MESQDNNVQRCINLDWFEVYCLEPYGIPHNEEFFKNDYIIQSRAYGTPQYREMFTLCKGKLPYIEVRRNPYSIKHEGGIFPAEATHLRLCNSVLYESDPIGDLLDFLNKYDYQLVSITRADVALDFNKFDFGDDPADIIAQIMRGDIAKINQSNISSYGVVTHVSRKTKEAIKHLDKDDAGDWETISAHGRDAWSGMTFNSLKWGAPTSPISTKLYNKSLELDRDGHDKFHIRDCWQEAGLDTDAPVWRVEFSIRSHISGFVRLYDNEIIKNDITMYSSRSKLLWLFMTLQHKYFHFKTRTLNRNGKPQRKDRCPDKVLFNTSFVSEPFRPMYMQSGTEPTRTDKMLRKRLLQYHDNELIPPAIREASELLALWQNHEMRFKPEHTEQSLITKDYLEKLQQMSTAGWSHEDIVTHQQLIKFYTTRLGNKTFGIFPQIQLFHDIDETKILLEARADQKRNKL